MTVDFDRESSWAQENAPNSPMPRRDASCARLSEQQLEERGARPYSPYAVDWRFLPENVLLAKDFVRHHLALCSNTWARSPTFRSLWTATIGRRVAIDVRNAGILLVHIPKTGGTSISKVLYGRNLPHYTALFWKNTYGPILGDLPFFAVVREPMARLMSAYRMEINGGTDIIAYSRYYRGRLRGLESFEIFVDHLFENRANLSVFPVELREQADFILDQDGRVMVDRLFALDPHAGLPTELGRWLSIPAVPHLNATPPLPLEVSRAARRKVERIYHRDLEIYDHLTSRGGVADRRDLDHRGIGTSPPDQGRHGPTI